MSADDGQQGDGRPARGPGLCNRRVDGRYTMLPNAIVQGTEVKLTPNQFRVLCLIASLPEDWNLRIEQVAKTCCMGRDAVYDAIYGLQEHRLARHLVARGERGRIRARRWEFTLTPGVFLESDDPLFLESRIKRRPLDPDLPDQVPPDQVEPTLQRLVSHKAHSQKDPDTGEPVENRAPHGRATARAESKTGSAMGSAPLHWPFPDDGEAARRIRAYGMEPEEIWQQYRRRLNAGKIPRPPDNLLGYLVGIAKRMAKEALPPADPSALADARAKGWVGRPSHRRRT
jgi:hypothetical protein